MLSAGDKAIDFTLESTNGGSFTLSERVREGPVLLYFYVVDFGMTCTNYIELMNERFDQFGELNVSLVHINDGSIESHREWIARTESMYEHLSDMDEIVTKKYDATIRQAKKETMIGRVNRCFFLVDRDMTLRNVWYAEWPMDTVPMDELFENIRKALA